MRELSYLFLYVWNSAKNRWTEKRTSRGIRTKSSIAGTDPDSGLQLSSFDPLSSIQQLYNNFVPTSASTVRLGTQNQTEVSEIMRATLESLQDKNITGRIQAGCRTLVRDLDKHWSWCDFTEDESVFLNIFKETLSVYLLKRDTLLNDYVVSCCMLEFCGNALTLWFQSQCSYSEGSSWVAEQHLTRYHHSSSGCQLSQQHATQVANGVQLITILTS